MSSCVWRRLKIYGKSGINIYIVLKWTTLLYRKLKVFKLYWIVVIVLEYYKFHQRLKNICSSLEEIFFLPLSWEQYRIV